MSFSSYVANGFRVLGFSQEAIAAIVNDEEHKKFAFILACILSLLSGLVLMLHPFLVSSNFFGTNAIFLTILITFFQLVFGIGVVHLSARIFGATQSIFPLFAVSVALCFPLFLLRSIYGFVTPLFVQNTYSALPAGMVSMIPGLILLVVGGLFAVYSLCVFIFAVKETYQFSVGRAIGVVLVPVVVLLALMFAFISFIALSAY